MKITKQSPFTGKFNTIEIDCTKQQVSDYENGRGRVQDIFPDVPPEEREFIITGITPQEWDETFG